MPDVRLGTGGSMTLLGSASIRLDGALAVAAADVTSDLTTDDSTHAFFADTAGSRITVTLPTPPSTPAAR